MDSLRKSTKGLIAGATGCGGVLLGGSKLAALGLSSAGFTPVGPAAGSYAAALMSTIAAANGGAVPAGSTYALIQSMAMTQAGILGATSVLGGGILIGGVLGGALYFAGSKSLKLMNRKIWTRN